MITFLKTQTYSYQEIIYPYSTLQIKDVLKIKQNVMIISIEGVMNGLELYESLYTFLKNKRGRTLYNSLVKDQMQKGIVFYNIFKKGFSIENNREININILRH